MIIAQNPLLLNPNRMLHIRQMKRFIYYSLRLMMMFWAGPMLAQNIGGVINSYHTATTITASPDKITLDSLGSIAANDIVLIIQMKGATLDAASNNSSFGNITNYNAAGRYEFARVVKTCGNDIYLDSALTYNYNVIAGVQVIRVPEYTNVTVTSDIYPRAWNGTKGGVVALVCTGTLTMNAAIRANGVGYRGGATSPNYTGGANVTNYYIAASNGSGGGKGESFSTFTTNREAGRGKWGNAAGGGNWYNFGGGGGGNGGAGGTGNNGNQNTTNNVGGIGGLNIPYASNFGRIFMGGGGGSGQQNSTSGTAGGNGGGIVIIKASVIVGNTNRIYANGNDAAASVQDGPGGGGGGGTVLLDVPVITNLTVEARGGAGGNQLYNGATNLGHGAGGGGGFLWYRSTLPSYLVTGGNAGIATGPLNPSYNTTAGATPGSNGITLAGLNLNVRAKIATDTTRHFYLCNGDSADLLTLTGVPGYTTYSWWPNSYISTPSQRQTYVYPINPALYVATVSTGGCLELDTFYVDVVSINNTSLSDTSLCYGTSIQLFAQGAASYAWSPNIAISDTTSASPVVNPTGTITYSVKYTTQYCALTDSVVVSVIQINPVVTTDSLICPGDSLRLSVSGGTSYVWSPTTYLSSSTVPNPWCKPATSVTYSVQLNKSFCSVYDTVDITVINFSPTVMNDTILCHGSNLVMQASGGNTYLWSPAYDLNNVNVANPVLFGADSTMKYKVTISTAFCEYKDSVLVTVVNPLTSLSGPKTICTGDSVVLSATGGNFYAWTPAALAQTPSNASTYVKPTASTMFYVSSTKSICTVTDSVLVSVLDTLSVNAYPDPVSICEGDSVQINVASGGNQIVWSPITGVGNPYSFSTRISPVVSTDYVLKANYNACTAFDTLHVTVNTKPVVDAGPDVMICYGKDHTMQATASNATLYTWLPATTVDQPANLNPVAQPTSKTKYYLTAFNNFCSARDSVTIDISKPVAQFKLDRFSGTVPFGVTATNFSTGYNPMKYIWTLNGFSYSTSKDVVFSIDSPGTNSITLYISDSIGCIDSVTKTLEGLYEVHFYVPSTFTPNLDKLNDTWGLVYTGKQILSMRGSIYNTQGTEIYTLSYPSRERWDGGDEPPGVYAYFIQIVDVNNRIHNLSGTVTLLR